MTKKGRAFLAVLATLTVCLGLCTLLAVFLLPATIGGADDPANEDLSGVRYGDCPDSVGLLFVDESDRGLFLFLDFEALLTHVVPLPSEAAARAETLTWQTDYVFTVGPRFAGRLADRLGGVEMAQDGEISLWFSAAMEDFCSKELSEEEISEISTKFFEKISKTGLSSEDFMFIIEESGTDLSYSVCYDWISFVPELFSNCIFY